MKTPQWVEGRWLAANGAARLPAGSETSRRLTALPALPTVFLRIGCFLLPVLPPNGPPIGCGFLASPAPLPCASISAECPASVFLSPAWRPSLRSQVPNAQSCVCPGPNRRLKATRNK
ncbi:uncharacterized protein LOC103159937 [Cricetulus griseus]|uniref:Uncharacterized protein LOC103159937 n=1 Tax=Cricetulus griseus TaxID=10029 RepID=A0A9J7KEX9_CRIGR|nr:uncharacterized protein LOC103159937 [Cricetulus griseus]